MNIDKITVFRINDITTLILQHLQMKQNYLNQLLIQYTNDLNILKSIQKMDLDATKMVEELSFAIENQVVLNALLGKILFSVVDDMVKAKGSHGFKFRG